jgi:hypothetical protein
MCAVRGQAHWSAANGASAYFSFNYTVSILMEALDKGTISKGRPYETQSSLATPTLLSTDDVLCSRCRVESVAGHCRSLRPDQHQRLPHVVQNLLNDLYEPSPRSCLMTSRDSISRANSDLRLTWPPTRYCTW